MMPKTEISDVLERTASFFDDKILANGATPEGLDWNGEDAQIIRLQQVLKAVDRRSGFSINDVGCGYGTLIDVLNDTGHSDFTYTGYDLAPKMIEAGLQRADAGPERRFINAGTDALQDADFTVASGIFNKLMGADRDAWHSYVLQSLDSFFAKSRSACSCNFLTGYSDPERMRDDLYYPDPRDIFDHCMRLTPWVSINHDYGLYDFTVIMRRR